MAASGHAIISSLIADEVWDWAKDYQANSLGRSFTDRIPELLLDPTIVHSIHYFGSAARHDPNPSDIDLLIVQCGSLEKDAQHYYNCLKLPQLKIDLNVVNLQWLKEAPLDPEYAYWVRESSIIRCSNSEPMAEAKKAVHLDVSRRVRATKYIRSFLALNQRYEPAFQFLAAQMFTYAVIDAEGDYPNYSRKVVADSLKNLVFWNPEKFPEKQYLFDILGVSDGSYPERSKTVADAIRLKVNRGQTLEARALETAGLELDVDFPWDVPEPPVFFLDPATAVSFIMERFCRSPKEFLLKMGKNQ